MRSSNRALMVVALAVGACSGLARAEFGIGANLGAPTGLNFRVGQQKSLEGILGWSLNGQEKVELVGNLLFHGRNLGRESPITGFFPYAGVGLGIWSHNSQGTWIQVPLGIDIRFTVPIEVGLHVDPGMDIFPDTKFTVHWGLGIRYWFK